MRREDYENQYKELFDKYENEVLSTEKRINRLKELITFGRKFNIKYKVPYKHYFMGKPIYITDDILYYLEQLTINKCL